MAPFMRSITAIFAVGMVGGAAVLMLLPPASESFRPLVAQIPDPPAAPCKKQTWPMTDRQCQPWTAPRKEAKGDESTLAAAAAIARGSDGVMTTALRPTIAPEVAKPAPALAPANETVSEPSPPPTPPSLAPSAPRSTRAAQATAPPPPVVADMPAEASAVATPTPALATAPERTAAAAFRAKAQPARTARPGAQPNPIPVTALAADGSRRTIVIRPTSQQDVYYYAARRDTGSMAYAR